MPNVDSSIVIRGVRVSLATNALTSAGDVFVSLDDAEFSGSRPAAKALRNVAGTQVDEALGAVVAAHAAKGIRLGETFATAGGDSQCKRIVHAVVEQGDRRASHELLVAIYLRALDHADRHRAQTVVFAAPDDPNDAADALGCLLRAIDEHAQAPTGIGEVVIGSDAASASLRPTDDAFASEAAASLAVVGARCLPVMRASIGRADGKGRHSADALEALNEALALGANAAPTLEAELTHALGELRRTNLAELDAVARRALWREAYRWVSDATFSMNSLAPDESHPARHIAQTVHGTPTTRLAELLESVLERRDVELMLGRSGESSMAATLLRMDPGAALREYLTPATLEALARTRAGLAAEHATDTNRCSEAILQMLGFVSPAVVQGLNQHREALVMLRNRARDARGSTLVAGTIAEGGTNVEGLAKTLIRLHARHAFALSKNESVDACLRQLKLLSRRQKVEDLGLGVLMHIVSRLDVLFADVADPPATRHRATFGARRFLHRDDLSFPEVRNSFVHHREQRVVGAAALRATATEFFEQALDWLTHLASGPSPLYPTTVGIRAIEVDRWGRRTLSCVTDAGARLKLHTDAEVRPGATYFYVPIADPPEIMPLLLETQTL